MKHGAIGQAVPRIDGALKVQGAARFAAEVAMENLAYAALVHSTVARGRITFIDSAQAEAADGVVLVMTYQNAPRLHPPKLFFSEPGAVAASNLPIMQDDRVHWNGEVLALVLAETQEQADHAATLVQVRIEPEPATLVFEQARRHARHPDHILGEPALLAIGDAEAALRAAPFRVDQIYRTPRHSHAAIEPHAVTVAWQDDTLTVHDATQMLHGTRSTLAKIFDLPETSIRISSPFVGGGFGGKGLWSHHVLAIAAARLANRPVRLNLSRAGVFRITGGRTCTEQRVALGARADGTLDALIHTGVAAMTSHNYCPEQFTFPARHLYGAATFRLEQKIAEVDMLANTFMRAPGESVGTFALESALDELAEALDLDPLDLRRRIEPNTDPTSGKSFSARHLLEAYDAGAAQFGWADRAKSPRARRSGEWLIGMGVATATYPYMRLPGGVARIRLSSTGATAEMGSHEMGMGTATVQGQLLADRLGLELDQVRFDYGHTDLPAGTLAGGSSQTASIAAAIEAAATALTGALLQLAGNDSPLAGLSVAEVLSEAGGLCHRDDPGRRESYASILSRAGRAELVVEAPAPPPGEAETYSMHSYGCQFTEVRVNEITGEVRVARMLGSFDCGRILNPQTATSQFRGGMIMGLGLALTEHTLFDERSGRIMNPSLAEYHVPVHLDVPHIDVIWTGHPDPHSPVGAKGIGEIGITGVAASVANAIYNATGRRIRDLPITLDKLM